ncbi:delta-lactam-biosynthetic de-N-acetylase [Gracilibacillus xinjiangensis]|uniref:Delta-lactam-biosynthetic de-N-acetylase n=1 Tax=Gracilibacillus xinjiangensis TaxID=1193282 RepID=A0ABV8WTW4_9BACI
MRKLYVTFLIGVIFTMLPIEMTAVSYGWGYKKATDHEQPDVGKYKEILEKYNSFYVDTSGDKHVYLTFDNGYEAGFTEQILDVLKEENVPATFFLTGHYVDDKPDLVKRMLSEGHIIGNHSDTHRDFTKLSKEELKEDIEILSNKLKKVSNKAVVQYVRPPKGTFNEQSLQWANELGYTHVFWSLAFVDWNEGQEKGWQYAYNQVIDQIHPGAIVLMHTVSKDNADALAPIIKELKKQGYEFKSLDDLMMKQLLPEALIGL